MDRTRREFLRGSTAAGLTFAAGTGLSRGSRAFGQSSSKAPGKATIRIDLERNLGEIDPMIFGGFVEHKGKCVYGGLFDEGSALSDRDGDRKDVLEAIRDLRVTQLRWPGGNSVSDYHWQDGVGQKAARPVQYERAWMESESNRYGTNEFLATCRKVRVEPYICVNMGTGSMDEAMNWVEYCNRPGGTLYADLRAKNGHAEPYGVKYWGLGNEVFGSWQIGHKPAEEYARQALDFAKVMKLTDPSIKLVASGSGVPEWDRPVLEMLGEHTDYISAHYYAICDDLKEYYEILGSLAEMEAMIRSSAGSAEAAAAKLKRAPVAIAIDEWNIIPSHYTDKIVGNDPSAPYHFTLRDALWVAGGMNALLRNCRSVKLANHANLINDLSPIYTSRDGLLRSALYDPLKLYAARTKKIGLDVATKSESFETRGFGSQRYLDTFASYDPVTRTVALAVVNRCKEAAIASTIDLSGMRVKPGGSAVTISGDTPEAANLPGRAPELEMRRAELKGDGERIEYLFPKHSISWLEWTMA